MKTDSDDGGFGELLDAAAPDMNEGWEERAVEGMAKVHPARGLSRRWALAAVGAVALVGLGFVPIPVGQATGVLERAMAMASQATTVHMIGHAWTPKDDYDFERWVSDDGFYRSEKRSGGEVLYLQMNWGARELSYSVEDGQGYAFESFDPTERHRTGTVMPNGSYVERFFESFKRLYEELGVPPPEMKITERRERSLWGGAVDVVEAEWTIEGEASISGVTYRDGDIVRIRAEIDPRTKRLLRMEQCKFEGLWEPRYEAEYEWDVEIPQAVLEFRPPKGTTLTRSHWWEERAGQVVAEGETADWKVTVHAVDVNRHGDIVLSLSRELKPGAPTGPYWNASPIMRAAARDDAGIEYEQLGRYGCNSSLRIAYWTTILERPSEAGRPRTVTLTIWPYAKGAGEEQSVTFQNLRLPPRQDVEDVWEAAKEVIQY